MDNQSGMPLTLSLCETHVAGTKNKLKRCSRRTAVQFQKTTTVPGESSYEAGCRSSCFIPTRDQHVLPLNVIEGLPRKRL